MLSPSRLNFKLIILLHVFISTALLEMVDDFVKSYCSKVEETHKRHSRARMKLMEKRTGNSTYGLKAWVIYGTTDETIIMSKIRLEELFKFELDREPSETYTSKPSFQQEHPSQPNKHDYWGSEESTKVVVKEKQKKECSGEFHHIVEDLDDHQKP